MQTALGLHPQVFCTENRLFGEFCETWSDGDGKTSPRLTLDVVATTLSKHVPLADAEHTREQWRAELFRGLVGGLLATQRQASGKSIIVDKITPYPGTIALVLSEIDVLAPSAAMVHLIRDPRDHLVSAYFHWMRRSEAGLALLEKSEQPLQRLFNDAFLEEWASDWTMVNASLLGNRRVSATVRYERLVAGFYDEFTLLLSGLGLPASSSIVGECQAGSSFLRMSGGRQPGDADLFAHVRNGRPGDWRRWFTRRDAQICNSHAGELLRDLGYAQDGWDSSLPEDLGFPLRDHL